MAVTWILVANASEARLFSNNGPGKGLSLIKSFEHPESRVKGVDLVSDRPGHYQSAGNGHGAYVQTSDPKENEADRFARELIGELDNGRTSNSCKKIALVSSPAFLGTLNGHMNSNLEKMVSCTIEKDYTKEKEQDLAGILKDYMRI